MTAVQTIDDGPVAWLAHGMAMAGRSIQGVIRQPQLWIPSLAFPLFFSAVSAAAFDRTTSLPGFPEVDSLLTFLLPATVIQGVMFSSTSAGTETAIDMENGFHDRLLTSPVTRVPLFLGRLGGVISLSVLQTLIFTTVFLVFGASFAAGFPGLLVMIVVAATFSAAVGAFSMIIALRTGSVEAVNGFFPILFILVFLSSAFFPPEVSGGWFETAAGINPISWMIDGSRELVITGWDTGSALTAIGVSSAMMVVLLGFTMQSLRASLRS